MMPWVVKLVCCRREDGEYRAATWEEAANFRESYTSGVAVCPQGYGCYHLGCPNHHRAGIITEALQTAVARSEP